LKSPAHWRKFRAWQPSGLSSTCFLINRKNKCHRRKQPEPLEEGFSLDEFEGRLKALLMDQGFIAGIGNVYGDEILFQSRTRPSKKAHELKKEEIKRVYKKIRYVLRTACEHDADLSWLDRWFVTGRSKGYCPDCGSELKRIKIQFLFLKKVSVVIKKVLPPL
jgi:formamidopyrimidine-DNA glycosylase